MLDQRTYPDPAVVKFAEQVVPLKVDGDKNPKIMEKFKVYGFPTILFIEPSGKVLGQFVGFRPPRDYIAESKKILAKWKSK